MYGIANRIFLVLKIRKTTEVATRIETHIPEESDDFRLFA